MKYNNIATEACHSAIEIDRQIGEDNIGFNEISNLRKSLTGITSNEYGWVQIEIKGPVERYLRTEFTRGAKVEDLLNPIREINEDLGNLESLPKSHQRKLMRFCLDLSNSNIRRSTGLKRYLTA